MDYYWSKSLGVLASKTPTKKLCKLAVKLFVGSTVLPRSKDLAQTLLTSAAEHSESLEHLNQVQFSKAYLKKLEGVQEGKPSLLAEGNQELVRLANESHPASMFVMARELIKIRSQMKAYSRNQAEQTAFGYLKKAVELKHTPAYFYMGLAYEEGIGVEPNMEEAIEYYSYAASENDPQAYFKLAQLKKEDAELNFKYTKKAAELGLLEAQHNLGVSYLEKGEVKRGFAWQLEAAKHDFYPSVVNIGCIFLYGKGEILSNPLAAYIWLCRAQKFENSPQLEELIRASEEAIKSLKNKA